MKRLAECAAFGRELVRTGDLDPIYITLKRTFFPPEPAVSIQERLILSRMLERWLVGYSMFYHAGVASHLATVPEGKFWIKARQGVVEKWPHGSERRHFRGSKALLAINYMEDFHHIPEQVVRFWTRDKGGSGEPWTEWAKYETAIRLFPQYGPWITFKLVDIFERVLRLPVVWPAEPEVALDSVYDEPAKGAYLVLNGTADHLATPNELEAVIKGLLRELQDLSAPPGYDRRLGLQEAETILCKFKSHHNGHYHIGKDIEDIRGALLWFPGQDRETPEGTRLRQWLTENMPQGVQQQGAKRQQTLL